MSTTEQSSREQKIVDKYFNFIANTSIPVAVTLTEAKEATLKDRTLQTVFKSGRKATTKTNQV